MEWATELHHGVAYAVGHQGDGQQSKTPVVIIRKDIKHAEDTCAALREVDAEASRRLGEEGPAFVRHLVGAGGEDVGVARGPMPDMFSEFGVGVLGD